MTRVSSEKFPQDHRSLKEIHGRKTARLRHRPEIIFRESLRHRREEAGSHDSQW
ncbi:hypothetical protein GCM10009647_053060 [Streptomyces sanglieri]